MVFPISGVEAPLWLPPLVTFVFGFLSALSGLTGAFLLLPFQVSVLGYTSPSVSATNLLYNIVATPAGVLRFLREGRMLWPLTWVVVAGTIPGVVLGGVARLELLPDPAAFKAFVGFVLLYLAARLLWDFHLGRTRPRPAAPAPADFRVRVDRFDLSRIEFDFQGEPYSCPVPGLFVLSLLVGVISGIYGIGGGAILGPIFIALWGLPIHAIAGALLLLTLITSVAGTIFFWVASIFYAYAGVAISPDWLLGGLFGLGGLAGIYCGARVQRRVPALWLKLLLGCLLLFVALRYVGGFLLT